MTQENARQLMLAMLASYPNAYKHVPTEAVAAQTKMLAAMLEGYAWGDIQRAYMAYQAADTTGFPPTAGALISQLDAIEIARNPDSVLTEAEAWDLYQKALSNSGYHAREEYEKLPPDVQRAAGSPDAMRAACMLDADALMVEKSHFLKAFREIRQRSLTEKRFKAIPTLARVLELATDTAKKLEEVKQ